MNKNFQPKEIIVNVEVVSNLFKVRRRQVYTKVDLEKMLVGREVCPDIEETEIKEETLVERSMGRVLGWTRILRKLYR